MSLRACLGCAALGNWGRSGRCTSCQRARVNTLERAPKRRLRKAARYNRDHQRARVSWWCVISSGERVLCARCDQPIGPLDAWDLDHLDNGTSRPSHAACNRGATTRKATAQ